MKFQNRTALITGAAGRIGQKTAAEFANFGVKLYLSDINAERLNAFAGTLRETGADVYTYIMDVSNPDSINKTANEILADAGHIDILVNNAGSWPRFSALQTSDDLWTDTINLNLHSVFRLSKFFAASMKEQQYGRIINLASIAGICGLPSHCAYSVAKAGVMMLTKNMAMELAKHGVTVNSVSPGLIKDAAVPTNGTWLGYTGTGEDIARAILFLADDDAGYITGTDIPVDGGRILGPLNPAFKG